MKFFTRLSRLMRYLGSVPWWERQAETPVVWGWRYLKAHVYTAWASVYHVEDNRITHGRWAGRLYSPAATFWSIYDA